MMLATNWGVYEICQRHAKFIEPGDSRDMEIRARDKQHLHNLRVVFPLIGSTVNLSGDADFPFRAFISRPCLAMLLADLADEIDYVQFKKDAVDPKLHNLLSRMWSVWLAAYPKGSVYSKHTRTRAASRR